MIMQTFQITETFTKAEFLVMCAILNAVGCSPETFIGNISAGFDDEDTSKIDEGILLKKISRLTMTEIEALMDFIHQFWDKDGGFDIDEGLEELGLNFEN